MNVHTRHAVLGLCLEGSAEQALQIVYRMGPRLAAGDPAARLRWLRMLGHALAAEDRLRSSAAAHLRALRLKRDLRQEITAADWGPVAAAYRELWRRTGCDRYLRRYQRFTRERTDEIQTHLARQDLAALRRRPQCSQRT